MINEHPGNQYSTWKYVNIALKSALLCDFCWSPINSFATDIKTEMFNFVRNSKR